MYQLDLANTLYILMMFLFIMCFTYSIIHVVKHYTSISSDIDAQFRFRVVICYARKLYVADYECYHKYEIWRYFLFS